MTHVIKILPVLDVKLTVFELASKYVYPSVRRRIVEILYYEYGLSQKKISKLMHIDQSTVARYLEGERGGFIDFKIYPQLNRLFKEYVEKIIREQPDKYRLLEELSELTLYIMGSGYVCPYHARLDETVDISKCRVCIRLFGREKTR